MKTLKDLGLSQHEIEIKDLAIDSRLVQSGAVFLAYPGARADGRDFIETAIQKGARAVVYECCDGYQPPHEGTESVVLIPRHHVAQQVSALAAHFFNHPSHDINVIGVTGTNGKTSTTHFLAQALDYLHQPCAVLGTLGCGTLTNLKPSDLTTLDSVRLQATLRDVVNQGCVTAALEVSSHALHQGRIQDVRMQIGAFTNLSRDHLDYHGSMEAYAAAKSLLFQHKGLTHAAINADDACGRAYIEQYHSVLKIIAYGIDSDVSLYPLYVRGHIVALGAQGIDLYLKSTWGSGSIRISVLGRINAYNILTVASLLCAQGIAWSDVLKACSSIKPVAGRLHVLQGTPQVVIDYAHTPDALSNLLQTVRSLCTGSLWCVFGCGGNRDRGKRSMMARIAETHADHVLVTDDNPRFECSKTIAQEIQSGFKKSHLYIADRAQAIRLAIESADQKDFIVIAGKGQESHQIVGSERIPFSDAETAQSVLNQRCSIK